jgi:hypothetical protein
MDERLALQSLLGVAIGETRAGLELDGPSAREPFADSTSKSTRDQASHHYPRLCLPRVATGDGAAAKREGIMAQQQRCSVGAVHDCSPFSLLG